MKEIDFDNLAISRAENEGMVLRQKQSDTEEVLLSPDTSFNLKKKETDEGIPEAVFNKKY